VYAQHLNYQRLAELVRRDQFYRHKSAPLPSKTAESESRFQEGSEGLHTLATAVSVEGNLVGEGLDFIKVDFGRDLEDVVVAGVGDPEVLFAGGSRE
jgi:hypothetical protein